MNLSDGNGNRITDVNAYFKKFADEAVKSGVKTMAAQYQQFVEDLVSDLTCPIHGEPPTRVQIDQNFDPGSGQGELKASFEGCCEELTQVAEKTVAEAWERGDFEPYLA
jgi:hypothetical protein